MAKYKLGDIFVKKNTRDTVPVSIVDIKYGIVEPEYRLKQIKFCGDDFVFGESALEELYNKIK